MHNQTIAISAFRTNLISYLKRAQYGAELVITLRGHEIARILPPKDAAAEARKELKKLRAHCKIGDVVSPIRTEWKANK